MLPLYKIFSLLIRVFSKPLVAFTRRLEFHQHPGLRSFFIRLGNTYHRGEQYINRRFLKLQSKDYVYKELNEELALVKGVEFFYEALLYTILISLPVAEMIRADRDSKRKAQEVKKKEKEVDAALTKAAADIKQLRAQVDELKRQQQIQADLLSAVARTKRLLYLDLLN